MFHADDILLQYNAKMIQFLSNLEYLLHKLPGKATEPPSQYFSHRNSLKCGVANFFLDLYLVHYIPCYGMCIHVG